MLTVVSVIGAHIRLTDERWSHITEEHSELAGMRPDVLEVLERPVRIVEGSAGQLLATREVERGKWLVVVYREFDDDGFIITAFLTRRVRSLFARRQVWP
jgi:hypothetical protein